MRSVPCPSGCGIRLRDEALAIAHAESFHGYDKYAVERETGLTHLDKELWAMLPLSKTEDNARRG